MSFTIIKGLSLPEPKKSFKKGSKFDAVISSLDVGDCVKFKGKGEASYFLKRIQDQGMKGAMRTIEGHYYSWRTA